MTQEEKQLLFRDLFGRLPRNEIVKDAVELTITNTSFIPLPKLNIKAGDKAKIIIVDSLQEEPKCIYNRTLDERKKSCKYCSAACSVRIEEEPVSEDLEEEFYRFIDEEENIPKMCNTRECIAWGVDIASHFAEWGRKQMMKDAVDGQVVYQIGSSVIAPTDIRYKVVSDRVYIPNVKLGDKVKIIVIKED